MVVLLAIALALPGLPSCGSLPVPGPIVGTFDPTGHPVSHWGVDLAVPVGTPVRAAATGVVTFAGQVAGNRTVTVHHGGGVRSSYSFLLVYNAEVGQRVGTGQVIGASGEAHDRPGLHFSARINDRYVDPDRLLACSHHPGEGLRLVSSWRGHRLYAVRRATRHPGRDLRPSAHCASHGRRSRAAIAGSRCHYLHHRR